MFQKFYYNLASVAAVQKLVARVAMIKNKKIIKITDASKLKSEVIYTLRFNASATKNPQVKKAAIYWINDLARVLKLEPDSNFIFYQAKAKGQNQFLTVPAINIRLATFEEDDKALHQAGMNRVGNIIIPSQAYVELEGMLRPFFTRCLAKQQKLGRLLAPHEMIRDLGLELHDEDSFVYWAAKNGIPVFCPAPTDGAFGLQMYFFKQANPKFGVDVSGDLPKLGQMVLDAEKTAGIILGGGVAKHHAIGANILREGFDYAVYVSTGTPYDGSLSGARTSEAVSWGKIKEGAKTVHVDADASLVFPMLAYKMLGRK